MKPASPDIAAVPWYTHAEHYEAFRQTASDAEIFFASFDQWVDAAMEHERAAEKRGVILFRVRMSIQAFTDWCHRHGFQNDAVGRSTYADQRAAELLGSGL